MPTPVKLTIRLNARICVLTDSMVAIVKKKNFLIKNAKTVQKAHSYRMIIAIKTLVLPSIASGCVCLYGLCVRRKVNDEKSVYGSE